MQPVSLREKIKEILYDLCGGLVYGDNLEVYVNKIMDAMKDSFDQDLNRLECALSSYHLCQGDDITK